MAEHNDTGASGEHLAARFLEERGYTVLHRNWRHGRHEVDLVAQHGQELVFVEVKTRSSARYGQPEEAVKKGKRGNLIKAANAYLEEAGRTLAVRFDIVSVILHPGGKPYVHHIPEAFYPTIHDRPR
ncbi:MAG: YraN family protein [Flavobacteriales bacterium]|jgi:putative endonuclease|nr:YraN family protein [Flavobacteriales bacterium]